jgi:hypothetical protein
MEIGKKKKGELAEWPAEVEMDGIGKNSKGMGREGSKGPFGGTGMRESEKGKWEEK